MWQSASNGKVTKRELQTVLRDLTKSKSMTLGFKLTLNISLLLTTTVAADVQSQLEPFQSGEVCSEAAVAMHCCAY